MASSEQFCLPARHPELDWLLQVCSQKKGGYNLVLTARRGDRLEALNAKLEGSHEIRAHAVPKDHACAEAPAELAGALNQDGIRIDGLVNCAV